MELSGCVCGEAFIIMRKSIRIIFHQVIPIFLLLVWLIIIGVLVWQRVCESHQPPFHDALTYLQKAKSFWENVAQGWEKNPLNLVEAVRPPGTVLLSYPFGFTEDYRGFLFRTVFVPFIIWVFALLISVLPVCRKKNQSFWPAMWAIFLLGPMPFFFQFEYPTQAYWGLMDGFLASLAALTVACAVRSLVHRSFFWAVCSALVAAFCPLVKPSGSLILLLTTVFWSGTAFFLIVRTDSKERRKAIRFWVLGTSMFVLFGGTISWFCLHSDYLNPELISYFKQATVVLRNEFKTPFSFKFLKTTLNSLFGPQLIIALMALVLIFRTNKNNLKFQISDWIFISASILFAIVGGWFWIYASSVAQIRYFYPFALMIVVPLIYISFRKLATSMPATPGFIVWGLKIACVLPALNLVLLLSVMNPSARWQSISGVSMQIGSGKAGVSIATDLLNELQVNNESPVVYLINQTPELHSFQCYGYYKGIIQSGLPNYSTRIPIDWQRPSTIRICEVVAADYILFIPLTQAEQENAFNLRKINSFEEEQYVLGAFLSSLKAENGLVTKFENPNCRLALVKNKEKLQEAFDLFIKDRTWRQVFVEENAIATEKEKKSTSRKVTLNFKEPTLKISYYFDIIDNTGNNLTIAGWGFLDGLNSNSLKPYLLLKKEEQIISYNTVLQIRKDLTTWFIKTGLNLDSAGFQVKIPIQNFEPGTYNLGLYIEKGNQTGIVFSDKFITIKP